MVTSDFSLQDQDKARHYKQLGLEPGAPMRDVEAAYWRFARELKGQAAMAPYNAAYEALSAKAQRTPASSDVVEQPAVADEPAAPALPPRRPSRFNWQD